MAKATELPPMFRLEIKLRNNRMIRAREAMGHASAKSAAEGLGCVSYHTWVAYESMGRSPMGKDGNWREAALKIADALYQDPEELWPKEARIVAKNRVAAELSAGEVGFLLGEDPSQSMLMEVEARPLLMKAMESLRPREREVVERSILAGDEIEVIAKDFCVSRARVQSIRRDGVRHMRTYLREQARRGSRIYRQGDADDDGDPSPGA